jgi:ABC-type antimicrobial peptide transport system permease subunit
MKGNDCFTIFLPPGHHAVELNAGDSFTYGISLTSLWSSTGIAIFGTLAVALLVCMYVFLKFVRKKYSTA